MRLRDSDVRRWKVFQPHRFGMLQGSPEVWLDLKDIQLQKHFFHEIHVENPGAGTH
jgi:hypothetical protein